MSNPAGIRMEVQVFSDELKGSFSSSPHASDTPAAFATLHELLETRRAIRVFDGTPVPQHVMEECLNLALLTPSSSNLQPWEFYWIRSPELRPSIVSAFINQSAAKTASEIIVVVARANTWDQNREKIHEVLQSYGKAVSEKQLRYYSHVCKDIYNQGKFGIRGFFKRIVNSIIGINRAVIRHPSSHGDMRIWAVKSTALACQTLMLAFQAMDYDTCPLEGMDAKRLKSILKLDSDAVVMMGIAVGKRSYNGIASPRVRLDRNLFVKEV